MTEMLFIDQDSSLFREIDDLLLSTLMNVNVHVRLRLDDIYIHNFYCV